MSSQYEYRRIALRIPVAPGRDLRKATTSEPTSFYGEDVYLLPVEQGASNCTMFVRDRSGREKEVLERNWQLSLVGSHNDVIRKVCRASQFCEGGMTRGAKGRSMTPEGYIRAHRKALDEACDQDLSRRVLSGATIKLNLDEDRFAADGWLRHLREIGRLTESDSSYWTHELRLGGTMAEVSADVLSLAAVILAGEWVWLGIADLTSRIEVAWDEVGTRKVCA